MRERQTIDDVLSGRAAVARRWFEVPVLGAALLVIPVVSIEEYSTTGWLLTVAADCQLAHMGSVRCRVRRGDISNG